MSSELLNVIVHAEFVIIPQAVHRTYIEFCASDVP